jgi:hypothetical protein
VNKVSRVGFGHVQFLYVILVRDLIIKELHTFLNKQMEQQMHHELRIKSLLQVMRGNSASLDQIQAITEIEPLVVRKVLVDLQKEGVAYYLDKKYGLMDYKDSNPTIQIFLEKADEYIAKGIAEGFGDTEKALRECLACNRIDQR